MTCMYEDCGGLCGGHSIRHIVPSQQDSLIVSDGGVIVVDKSIRDETTLRGVK